jgi:transposase
MESIMRVGIDLSKNVFVICGVDSRERVTLKRTLKRNEVLSFFADLQRCLIGMEAGSGAHYWARELNKLGHDARIMDPRRVAPYRSQGRTGKNDSNDAEAICEAVGRPRMVFVPIKDPEQQAILVIHRVRKALVNEQNRVANQVRGLLAEFGIVIPKGLASLKRAWMSTRQVHADDVPMLVWEELDKLYAQLGELHARILGYDRCIKAHVRADARARRLAEIHGVGAITASAVVASVGNGRDFKNGRQFGAWLGLTPKQYSTGGRTILGKITKRGDTYLRTLLIHGARSELNYIQRRSDPKSLWAQALCEKKPWNKVAVALANKHARLIWAILAKDLNSNDHTVAA